jgi:hypothetical protein
MIALTCTSELSVSNWLECIKEALTFAVETVFGGMVDLILEAIQYLVAQTVKWVLESVGTLWLKLPAAPIGQSGTQAGDTVAFVERNTVWIVAAVATISVIVGAVRLIFHEVWDKRGEGTEARELLKSLLTMVIVSAAGVTAVGLLTEIADGLADEIIRTQLGENGQRFADRMSSLVVTPMQGDVGLAIVLIMGITAIITSFVQIVLMIVRNGMLILLAGILPLAAAATNTEQGKAWFRRVLGWLIAFILYKPVAALIYATALALAGSPDGGVLKIITGVTMMIFAVIALPALLRFVSPKGA